MSDHPGRRQWRTDSDGWSYPRPAEPPPPGPQAAPFPGGGRRPSPWGFWVALSAVGLVAGLVAAGAAVSRSAAPEAGSPTSVVPPPTTRPATPPGPSQPAVLGPVPGAKGPIAPGQGTVAYTDQFGDPTSGWTTEALASGTTFAYRAGRYVVTARGALHHFAMAPYELPIAKLSVLIKATQSAGAPPGTGFGVLCAEGADLQTSVRYEFLSLNTGAWVIERRDGSLSPPVEVGEGQTAASPGSNPLTVEGMCNTLSDSRTTRLLMFVDGRRVADLEDSTGPLGGQGWAGGIDVASRSQAASSVSVSDFEERDLSG